MTDATDPVWFLAAHISKLAFSLEFQSDVLAALVLLVLAQIYRPRAHVVWGLGHGSAFALPGGDPPVKILTKTLFVTNWGFSTAEEIEVQLSHAPAHYQLSPPIEHRLEQHEDGTCSLLAPTLGSQEHVAVEFLQLNGRLPNILSVRSFDGKSRNVDIAPSRRFSPPLRYALAVLLVLGAFYALKLLFTLIVLAVR
jgi:hypothetical protein